MQRNRTATFRLFDFGRYFPAGIPTPASRLHHPAADLGGIEHPYSAFRRAGAAKLDSEKKGGREAPSDDQGRSRHGAGRKRNTGDGGHQEERTIRNAPAKGRSRDGANTRQNRTNATSRRTTSGRGTRRRGRERTHRSSGNDAWPRNGGGSGTTGGGETSTIRAGSGRAANQPHGQTGAARRRRPQRRQRNRGDEGTMRHPEVRGKEASPPVGRRHPHRWANTGAKAPRCEASVPSTRTGAAAASDGARERSEVRAERPGE